MGAPHSPVPVRSSTSADLDAIIATLTTAFSDDPVWGQAFPDPGRRAAQASALWRVLATSAQRYRWVLVTENVESVAVWIPPGGVELTPDEEAGLEDFLVATAGRPVADGIARLFSQFAAVRPSEPHFYLSLLGTNADHRGRGLGMSLLAENLARIDTHGMPAYLESSNPANDKRYASVGFAARDEIVLASGQVVTTMWRPAPPAAVAAQTPAGQP